MIAATAAQKPANMNTRVMTRLTGTPEISAALALVPIA